MECEDILRRRYWNLLSIRQLSVNCITSNDVNEAWNALPENMKQHVDKNAFEDYDKIEKSNHSRTNWLFCAYKQQRLTTTIATCIDPSACNVCKNHFYTLHEICNLINRFKPARLAPVNIAVRTGDTNSTYCSHLNASVIKDRLGRAFASSSTSTTAKSVVTSIDIVSNPQHGRYITRLEWLWMVNDCCSEAKSLRICCADEPNLFSLMCNEEKTIGQFISNDNTHDRDEQTFFNRPVEESDPSSSSSMSTIPTHAAMLAPREDSFSKNIPKSNNNSSLTFECSSLEMQEVQLFRSESPRSEVYQQGEEVVRKPAGGKFHVTQKSQTDFFQSNDNYSMLSEMFTNSDSQIAKDNERKTQTILTRTPSSPPPVMIEKDAHAQQKQLLLMTNQSSSAIINQSPQKNNLTATNGSVRGLKRKRLVYSVFFPPVYLPTKQDKQTMMAKAVRKLEKMAKRPHDDGYRDFVRDSMYCLTFEHEIGHSITNDRFTLRPWVKVLNSTKHLFRREVAKCYSKLRIEQLD